MLGWGYTTKQAKVIYKAWKQGKIEMEKQVMDKIFELADGNNRSCREGLSLGQSINEAVQAIFSNNYRLAERNIGYFANGIDSYERTTEINRMATVRIKAMLAANA